MTTHNKSLLIHEDYHASRFDQRRGLQLTLEYLDSPPRNDILIPRVTQLTKVAVLSYTTLEISEKILILQIIEKLIQVESSGFSETIASIVSACPDIEVALTTAASFWIDGLQYGLPLGSRQSLLLVLLEFAIRYTHYLPIELNRKLEHRRILYTKYPAPEWIAKDSFAANLYNKIKAIFLTNPAPPSIPALVTTMPVAVSVSEAKKEVESEVTIMTSIAGHLLDTYGKTYLSKLVPDYEDFSNTLLKRFSTMMMTHLSRSYTKPSILSRNLLTCSLSSIRRFFTTLATDGINYQDEKCNNALLLSLVDQVIHHSIEYISLRRRFVDEPPVNDVYETMMRCLFGRLSHAILASITNPKVILRIIDRFNESPIARPIVLPKITNVSMADIGYKNHIGNIIVDIVQSILNAVPSGRIEGFARNVTMMVVKFYTKEIGHALFEVLLNTELNIIPWILLEHILLNGDQQVFPLHDNVEVSDKPFAGSSVRESKDIKMALKTQLNALLKSKMTEVSSMSGLILRDEASVEKAYSNVLDYIWKILESPRALEMFQIYLLRGIIEGFEMSRI